MKALKSSCALLGLVCAATGCFRTLAEHPCDGDDAPTYCAGMATTTASMSTGTASTDDTSTSAPDTTHASGDASTSVASTAPETTSGSESTTSSDTSGGPTPFCGDGVVQPERNEECDGETNCDAECQRDRLIFTTSPPYFRGGMLHGLNGADNYCVSRAGMAGLPDPLNYRALLSDSTTDAAERLKPGGGRYILIDGTVVADSFAEMFSKPLKHAIDLDELGDPAYVAAWTGTRYGTARALPGDVFCGDWNNDGLNQNGAFGRPHEVDATWIEADISDCLAESTIYCVEQ